MDDDIEVIATIAGVFAEIALCVGFVDSALKLNLFVPELAANIDVSSLGPHAETDDESAFDKLVGVVTKNLAILASAGL